MMEHSKEVQDALHLLERALGKIAENVECAPDVRFSVNWFDVTTFDSELSSCVPEITLRVTQEKSVRL